MSFLSNLGKQLTQSIKSINNAGNNNNNNNNNNAGNNNNRNGTEASITPYEKDLKLYRDQIEKLKGDQAKIRQKISTYETEKTGEDFNYQNQINELAGQEKALSNSLKQNLDQLKLKTSHISNVRQTKKTVIDDLHKYRGYQNEDLEKQLRTFKEIEADVSTRDRLVEINQDAYQKKNFRSHALVMGFLGVMLIIFPVVSYLGGLIAGSSLTIAIMVILVLYFAYMAWAMNFLSVRKFTQQAGREIEVLAHDVENGVYVLRHDLSDEVFGKSHQIPCPGCPSGGGSGGGSGKINVIDILHKDKDEGGVVHNENAFYYYDGTSPPEKIIPPNGNKIDWNAGPDMGSRSTGRFTPGPKWTMPSNSCLPGWKKKEQSALPKGTLDNTDRGECLPLYLSGAPVNE